MQGLISQVLGPVVDVDFKDYLPQINEALIVNFEAEGKKQKLVLEVARLWRCIANDIANREIFFRLTCGYWYRRSRWTPYRQDKW